MEVFEPIRDFFQRRAAIRLTNSLPKVHVKTERTESHRGHFVFPGIDTIAVIELDDQRVGSVHYGINPLGDRLYISDFSIEREHQRRGIGLAALWWLWDHYQVPLVPMHEVGTSTGFWSKARQRFAKAGAELKYDIRTGDQEQEKQRWQHLVPEPEHERLIREYWEWVECEQAAGRPAGPGIQ